MRPLPPLHRGREDNVGSIKVVILAQSGEPQHLVELQITIEVTDAAKDLLAKGGYDRIYGARPLRRVITSRIEDQFSEELLRGRMSRGDTVVVDISPEGGFTFRAAPGRKETASEVSQSPGNAPA